MTDITDLPTQIVVLTRDQHRDRYLRSYAIRNPGADTGPGTQPYLDASSHADACVPLYADAQLIGDATNIRTARGAWLSKQLVATGLPDFLPATGAAGFVIAQAATGGGNIFQGDEIRDPLNGLRFVCLVTGLYLPGALVPIGPGVGTDTGTATNLPADTTMQWSSPRPGIGPLAVVFEQSDGSGLAGGHPAETDDEAQQRLIDAKQNPPATGNDAEYARVIRSTPGLAIEQPFTIPCALGAATMAFTFTMRPSAVGASRLPNPADISIVLANLQSAESGDDQIFAASLQASPVNLAFQLTWARKGTPWADAAPWPAFNADQVLVDGAVAPTAVAFRLTTGTAQVDPVPGQTIALFDRAALKFRRKRIAAVAVVSSTLSWDITVDATNNASDIVYAPQAGQAASPWSDSLQSLVLPVASYMDTFGPGEQFASLPDPGLRCRRQPEPPEQWPSVLTSRIEEPLFEIAAVQDVDLVLPAVPYPTPVGTPGVRSYLLELGDLAIYPS